MPFFALTDDGQWNPGNHRVWIYWVVAAPLTALMIGLGTLWWRLEDRRVKNESDAVLQTNLQRMNSPLEKIGS